MHGESSLPVEHALLGLFLAKLERGDQLDREEAIVPDLSSFLCRHHLGHLHGVGTEPRDLDLPTAALIRVLPHKQPHMEWLNRSRDVSRYAHAVVDMSDIVEIVHQPRHLDDRLDRVRPHISTVGRHIVLGIGAGTKDQLPVRVRHVRFGFVQEADHQWLWESNHLSLCVDRGAKITQHGQHTRIGDAHADLLQNAHSSLRDERDLGICQHIGRPCDSHSLCLLVCWAMVASVRVGRHAIL